MTWNCRRARADGPAWDVVRRVAPDVAVLQEVHSIPDWVRDRWAVAAVCPVTRTGRPQRFQSVTLVKGELLEPLAMRTAIPWVNRALDRFRNQLAGWRVRLGTGLHLNVVNVYSPAWPIEPCLLPGETTAGVQLEQNRSVWVTDLLWAWLREVPDLRSEPWLVAGDLNASITFDSWPGGPRGNREFQDRMRSIGLTECLAGFHGRLVPTFRNGRGGRVVHQIDHLYVSPPLADRLERCDTGDPAEVFGRGLSDHLAVVGEFVGSCGSTRRC